MTTGITQRKLVLGDTPTLALATVETARHMLVGHDEDDILALIEDGCLLFAWNIGLGEAREIRIYPPCIEHYKATMGGRGEYKRTEAQVTADLMKSLNLGRNKGFVAGTALRLLLNCGSTHIINLIEAKALRVVPGTTWGHGPTGSPVVTLASFEKFLTDRRVA